jgi:hypothetical protein
MTPEEFYAISARFDAAWKAQRWAVPAGTTYLDAAMADFINATREDVPALLAEVERLRGIDAEWRRIMARPHPEDGCWGAHQMRSQDACMGCERDAARAEVERLRQHLHLAGTARQSEATLRERAEAEVARLRAQVARDDEADGEWDAALSARAERAENENARLRAQVAAVEMLDFAAMLAEFPYKTESKAAIAAVIGGKVRAAIAEAGGAS